MPITFESIDSIISSRSAVSPSFTLVAAANFLFIEFAWAAACVTDGPVALGLIFWQRFFLGDRERSGSRPSFNLA